VFAFVVIGFWAPPMIGPSGLNGESVPNETINPLLLFELFHMTVVPALMQNNWFLFALGVLGFTLAESPDLVTSTVHVDDAEPQVLAAVHMLSGWLSSHAYLLFFCPSVGAQLRTAT
jgi:hypothetical protein